MDQRQAGCKSILIVEDDPAIRETLQQALQYYGYNAETAVNGKDGLEKLNKMAHPCLVLLDLMMPVMDGWSFVNAKSKDDIIASIPVVVVSAFIGRSKPIEVNDFIKKPINLDALLGILRKYC